MPFITEELWQHLKDVVSKNRINIHENMHSECLVRSSWPKENKRYEDTVSEEIMNLLQDIIRAIRNIRSKMNIKEKLPLNAIVSLSGDGEYELKNHADLLKRMANIEHLEIGKDLTKPENAACEVIGKIQAFVPLVDIIDPLVEKERQLKHLKQLEDYLTVVRRKLENKNFAARAPAHVVAMEQNREKELLEQINKVNFILNDLG